MWGPPIGSPKGSQWPTWAWEYASSDFCERDIIQFTLKAGLERIGEGYGNEWNFKIFNGKLGRKIHEINLIYYGLTPERDYTRGRRCIIRFQRGRERCRRYRWRGGHRWGRG